MYGLVAIPFPTYMQHQVRFLFDDQLNLENQIRFDPLTKEKKTGSSSNVKAPEANYNALVSAFFHTGAGENAIPTVIIMFV